MFKKIAISILCILLSFQYSFSQNENSILITENYYGMYLGSILKDLKKSYSITIDYKESDIPRKIVSGINFNEANLNYVFTTLLNNTNLQFKINYDNVIIWKKGETIYAETEASNTNEYLKNFTLTGTVKDKKSGESLPFANILIDGTKNGTTTNVDGYFTLFNIPSDTSILEIIYMGYERKYLILNPGLVKKELNIQLVPKDIKIDEVVVAAKREDLLQISKDVSLVSISPKQINSLPSLGEKDIFRSFQLLPGISGSNESSSGLYVRGGTPDQNLILYDGFTVYHVDHLFGMFSAFNSNAIKDVKLSKGGFESKFGGRLSSVMEVTGKDGNEKDFSLGAGISFLSINGLAEIPIGGNGSVIIAGRRSFKSFLYNSIFDKFNQDDETQTMMPGNGSGRTGGRSMAETEPSSYFYDLNAKATYKQNKNIYTISFFNGQDNLDNSSDMNGSFGGSSVSGGATDLTKWGNWGTSTKWSRKWNAKLYSNALISYSKYYSQRDQTQSKTIVRDDIEEEHTSGTIEDNTLQDFTFKIDNEYKTGRSNQLEFGIQHTDFNINYDFIRNDTIVLQQRNDIGSLSVGYMQDELRLFERWTLIPGIRASYYSVTDKVYFEPRFSSRLDLTENIRVKLAFGKYYQFANRIIRDDIESGSRDFWVLSDDEVIPVSSSNHYIAGIAYENKNFLFDIEAFHKDLYGLTEYSLMFTPSFMTMNFDEFFYIGDGYSRGIEFLLQKKFGKYTGWVGYTLSEVKYNFDVYGNDYFSANHDSPHELKFVNSYKYRNWTFAATWIYATGKPYTAPTGAYEIEYADGSSETFLSLGDKNSFRYDDYHRLDISANLEFLLGDVGIGNLGFSVFNLYNRSNIWYKTFEIIEGELLETNVNLLGITPNISFSVKF